MAYDPEARETGNSAMIIGIVALTLVVGGALAYFLTRPNTPDETGATTIVNTSPRPATNNTVIVEKAAPETVVVERAVPVPAPQTKTIIREKSTTNTTRVVPAPQTGNSGGGSTSPMSAQQPDITINNNAPSNASGGAPANDSASGAGVDDSAGSADALPPPAQP